MLCLVADLILAVRHLSRKPTGKRMSLNERQRFYDAVNQEENLRETEKRSTSKCIQLFINKLHVDKKVLSKFIELMASEARGSPYYEIMKDAVKSKNRRYHY